MKYEDMTIRDLRQLLFQQGVDASSFTEKKVMVKEARRLEGDYFDEAGRTLFRQLNLEPTLRAKWSNLDAIWKNPISGASVYVGNYQAASNRKVLDERNIKAVVNCQDMSSKNYFEHEEGGGNDDKTKERIFYHRFHIAQLSVKLAFLPLKERREIIDSGKSTGALDAIMPTFEFIDSQLESGNSVLVHCLAGAHRAGTTGVSYLMYKMDDCVDYKKAISVAKQCRPVINPLATLSEFLSFLEHDLKLERGGK